MGKCWNCLKCWSCGSNEEPEPQVHPEASPKHGQGAQVPPKPLQKFSKETTSAVPADPVTSPSTAKNILAMRDFKQLKDLLKEIDKATEKVSKSSLENEIANDANAILNEINESFEGASPDVSKSIFFEESLKVLSRILNGGGKLHWSATGLAMVAFMLNRFDEIENNYKECLRLLRAMRDLAKHVVALYPELSEEDEKLKSAVLLMTEGAAMCYNHIQSSALDRFAFMGITDENVDGLWGEIRELYPNIILTTSPSRAAMMATVSGSEGSPSVSESGTSTLAQNLYSPGKPGYPMGKGKFKYSRHKPHQKETFFTRVMVSTCFGSLFLGGVSYFLGYTFNSNTNN